MPSSFFLQFPDFLNSKLFLRNSYQLYNDFHQLPKKTRNLNFSGPANLPTLSCTPWSLAIDMGGYCVVLERTSFGRQVQMCSCLNNDSWSIFFFFFLEVVGFCFSLLVRFGCSFFLSCFCFKPPSRKTPLKATSPALSYEARQSSLIAIQFV